MDNSIFQWFNRLAQHTSWAHGFFRFYANYGIVLLGLIGQGEPPHDEPARA